MRKKGRRVKSIRGVTVDFDLLEVKQQIASRPKPVEVKAREKFVDERLRRRVRRMEDKIKARSTTQSEEIVEENKQTQTPVDPPKVEVEKIITPSPAPEKEEKPKRRYYKKKKDEDKE